MTLTKCECNNVFLVREVILLVKVLFIGKHQIYNLRKLVVQLLNPSSNYLKCQKLLIAHLGRFINEHERVTDLPCSI